MSEIKTKYEPVYDDNGFYCVVDLSTGKTLVTTSTEYEEDQKVVHFISDALNERDKLKEQNEKLKEAIQHFIDRVDKGEVRSVRSYNRFKEALKSCES